jgi:actin-related protein
MFGADIPNFSGIHQMIAEGIIKTDVDIRKEMYNNIVATGGNTLIESVYERIHKIVSEIAPKNTKIKIIGHDAPVRKYSPWIGASILSSLGSFQQMWMTRKEFEEHGTIFVEKKCP